MAESGIRGSLRRCWPVGREGSSPSPGTLFAEDIRTGEGPDWKSGGRFCDLRVRVPRPPLMARYANWKSALVQSQRVVAGGPARSLPLWSPFLRGGVNGKSPAVCGRWPGAFTPTLVSNFMERPSCVGARCSPAKRVLLVRGRGFDSLPLLSFRTPESRHPGPRPHARRVHSLPLLSFRTPESRHPGPRPHARRVHSLPLLSPERFGAPSPGPRPLRGTFAPFSSSSDLRSQQGGPCAPR
jgi:hypothetical protein